MTTDDLIALEKAATPGEWRAKMWMENHRHGTVKDADGNPIGFVHERRAENEGPANQDLICAIRNLAPELLALAKAAEWWRMTGGAVTEDYDTGELLCRAIDTYRAKLAQMRDGA